MNQLSNSLNTSFPVVAIGASAGGLSAFEAFFSAIPKDTNPEMAFIIIQHLAPDHESMLVELISRWTKMKVMEVKEGIQLQKNCIFVIPPHFDMALADGKFQLLNHTLEKGQRLPIDFFFRSLAQDLHERAIGIILSGTGSDGTLGIRAIKGEAGMVMAQTIESCQFNGMPSSAIATGLVDYILAPEKMPGQLINFLAHGKTEGPEAVANFLPTNGDIESNLKKIFSLIRSQTGHDFSDYKPNTINRRIQRRMAVHHIEDLNNYLLYIQKTPKEVEELFRDMLIGVTQFFRDQEAFSALEKIIIPKLFLHKKSNNSIRIWSAGCSTGEESYSIAILLFEQMEALKQSFTIQIFATDIDGQAIATARNGVYPSSIAADITPARLARFFSPMNDGSGYRIHKDIRNMLIFSVQDLIKDPPFSKIDLVCCRNVLIYLNAELQEKLIRLFHFALNPKGQLFLGTSESGGNFSELFDVVDSKLKLFQKKDQYLNFERTTIGNFFPPFSTKLARHPNVVGKAVLPSKLPLRELTEQGLLNHVISAGVLVNKQGEILYLHGRTGMYLELATGEVGTNNILKMAREGLQTGLSTSLHQSVTKNTIVRTLGLRVKTNGHFKTVNLCVRPLFSASLDTPLYLIILEEAPELSLPQNNDPIANQNTNAEKYIAALEKELRAKDEQLQNTHQELENFTQELRSSNEEMQSVNEELQSTNEELETSKEELQSVNEELTTVNNELNSKVLDLSRLNNDMNNLLAGTGIATIFVDHQLRILRFTPTASQIINLIPVDIGRPVSHLASKLVEHGQLVAETQTVLDTLVPIDTEVQTASGMWFIMHIMPYRTIENVIEGAVLTFVDITSQKQVEKKLEEALLKLKQVGITT
jgi:two-component system CheB/CheR fusion protein